MKQEFRMTVTFNIYTYADGFYEAKHILTKAAQEFEPCTDSGLRLDCNILDSQCTALDEPFDKSRTFQDADEASSYCRRYSNPVAAMLEVIQHQIERGFYSFASELLARL